MAVSNLVMSEWNELSIPRVITITFRSGEVVTYKRSGEDSSDIRNQLMQFTLPQYNFGEEKIDESTFDALSANIAERMRSLDKQHKSAVEEVERLFLQEKEKIEEFFKQQLNTNEQLHSSLSREMMVSYRRMKKKLDDKAESMKEPSQKIKIMIQWLRETNVRELNQAAQMLESEADYILKRLTSPRRKWDCFLSHVQKNSADLCRNVKDQLEKKGIRTWLDKSAKRLDKHGIVDGVVASSLFVLVLTTNYFQRPFCVFEYCLAVIAGRPIITVAESDPRYGGGRVSSFSLKGMFKHLLEHEIIDVHRTYWEGFISRLQNRIKDTINAVSMRDFGAKNLFESSILEHKDAEPLINQLKEDGLMIGVRLFETSDNCNTAKAFHAQCDGQGATLTVVETKDGKIFGGFSPVSWASEGEYVKAEDTWLFKLNPYEKFDCVDKRHAVCHRKTYGPTFGGSDIVIGRGKGLDFCHKSSYSKGILSQLKKTVNFEMKRYEVFSVSKLHV